MCPSLTSQCSRKKEIWGAPEKRRLQHRYFNNILSDYRSNRKTAYALLSMYLVYKYKKIYFMLVSTSKIHVNNVFSLNIDLNQF